MCGHGIIAVTTVVLETGLLPARKAEEEIRIDTPAGLVTARARVADGRVRERRLPERPLLRPRAGRERSTSPGLGRVRVDLAFGGAFYAYVQAKDLGLSLTPSDFRDLIDRGMAIKRAIMASRPIRHPFEEDLGFLYGTIFVGPAVSSTRTAATSASSPKARSTGARPEPESADASRSPSPAGR